MGWTSFLFIILHLFNINPVASLNAEFECPGNGIFPDPDNCQCFYDCANGVAFPMCCPDREYFDVTYKICNWEYNVDCKDRPGPGSTRFTSSSPRPTSPYSTTQTSIVSTTTTQYQPGNTTTPYWPENTTTPYQPGNTTTPYKPGNTTTPYQPGTSTTQGKWEKGMTVFNITDGFKYYTCEISFEFNVDDDLQSVHFTNKKSECSKSTYQEDTIQVLEKIEFDLSLNKLGLNLNCIVGVAMVDGVFLERLLGTLKCAVRRPCDSYLSSTCNKVSYYDSRCTQELNIIPDRTKEKFFAEFYGQSIIRLLSRLQNDPLKWDLVGHDGSYGRTCPDQHPAYNNIIPEGNVPGIYMFFMSPTSSREGAPIEANTGKNEELNELMTALMNDDNDHWQRPLRLDHNAHDLIIPFYIGKTGTGPGAGLQKRYKDHNQDKEWGEKWTHSINRWRRLMRSKDFTLHRGHFDLYFTFLEMQDDLDAEINERFFLDMFNFMDNAVDMKKFTRRSDKCLRFVANEIGPIEIVYNLNCTSFFKPESEPHDSVSFEVANMETIVTDYVKTYWYMNWEKYPRYATSSAATEQNLYRSDKKKGEEEEWKPFIEDDREKENDEFK